MTTDTNEHVFHDKKLYDVPDRNKEKEKYEKVPEELSNAVKNDVPNDSEIKPLPDRFEDASLMDVPEESPKVKKMQGAEAHTSMSFDYLSNDIRKEDIKDIVRKAESEAIRTMHSYTINKDDLYSVTNNQGYTNIYFDNDRKMLEVRYEMTEGFSFEDTSKQYTGLCSLQAKDLDRMDQSDLNDLIKEKMMKVLVHDSLEKVHAKEREEMQEKTQISTMQR